jgi:hypothetical protein
MQIGKQVPGPLHRIYRTKHNEMVEVGLIYS